MNNKPQKIIIYGCGAMALELAMYIKHSSSDTTNNDYDLIVTDIVSEKLSRADEIQEILGYPVSLHVSIESVEEFNEKKSIIGIGSAQQIKKVYESIQSAGGEFITVIHPSAVVSNKASVGKGVIIAPFVYVGPGSQIGNNTIINIRSTIGHDVIIGSGVVISPHCDINGNAVIGDHSFLGTAVVVEPGVNLGRYCKASSGVVVKKDVLDGMLVFNNISSKSVKLFDSKDGRNLISKK